MVSMLAVVVVVTMLAVVVVVTMLAIIAVPVMVTTLTVVARGDRVAGSVGVGGSHAADAERECGQCGDRP